ncbi:MAG: hypothetical protein EAX96_11830 [Candidatus Lokiarchaeota archaeon]|nr:hypothetical protein [Candidatus Lokiarchaeota archaeon]
MARTPYFMWPACDDLLEPEFITELINILEKMNNTILFFCDFDFISEKTPLKKQKSDNKDLYVVCEENNIYIRIKNSISSNHTKYFYGIFSISILKRIGGFPNHSRDEYFDDNLLVFKTEIIEPFHFIPKILFHRRSKIHFINKFSTDFKSNIRYIENFSIRQTYYRHYLRKLI